MKAKKQYPVKWDVKAFEELKEILKYAGKNSEKAPLIIQQSIKKSINLIRLNPFVFRVDELKTNNDGSYRAFVVFSYRISYRFDGKEIWVLRIRHTSRIPLEY
jgi:plasmid stabilization system protein ParE